MLRFRLGMYGLATLAAALFLGGVLGHSQTLSSWQPMNITAVDRGISPVGVGARNSTSARRRRFRPSDKMGRNGAPYRAGRVIVKFRDGASATTRLGALAQVSRTASMLPRSPAGDFDVVNIDASEDAEAAAQALAARADVEYAQPAYRVYAYAADTFVPNDPGYLQAPQWNFPAIDLERAWAIQGCATGAQCGAPSITIAIVDTGAAFQSGTLTHHAYAFCSTDELSATCGSQGGTNFPALGDLSIPAARAPDLAIADSRFVSPYDFIWNTAVPVDLDGHGTHVTSTIGELTNNGVGLAGIAFNARLMPVKVIDGDWDDIFHSPGEGTDDTVALGIRYAADHGANIINMSIGRTGPANCGTVSADGCAPVIESAIRYAVSKGCFVAIAAGNDGDTLPANQVEVIAEIASRIPGAVSVAALDRQNLRASYSTAGAYVELAAPGGDGADYIFQQTYDYTFTDTFNLPVSKFVAPRFDILAYIGYQGTSMATPHVSGVAALLMQQGIKDPATVEAVLEHFATDLGTPGRDNLYGFGEISARNTLRGLGLSK